MYNIYICDIYFYIVNHYEVFLVQNSFISICKTEGMVKLPPFSIYNYLHIPPHEIYNLFFRENNQNIDVYYNTYFQFIVSFGLLEINELILILLSCCNLHYSIAIPPSKLLMFFNIIGIDSDNLNVLNDFISKCPHNMDGKIEINDLIDFVNHYPSLISPIISLRHKISTQIFTFNKINEIQSRYTFYRSTGHLYFTKEIIDKLYFPNSTSCFKKFNNILKNHPGPYHCDYFPTFVGESLNAVICLLRTKYGLQYSARAQSLRIKSIQIDGESYSFPKLYAVGNKIDRKSSTSPLSRSHRTNINISNYNNNKKTIDGSRSSYNTNNTNTNTNTVNTDSRSTSVSINHSSSLKDGTSESNDNDSATTNENIENTAINTLVNSNRNSSFNSKNKTSLSASPICSSQRDSTTLMKSRAIPIFQGVKIVPTNN